MMNDTMTKKETPAQRGPFKLLIGSLVKPSATMDYLRQAQRRWWVFPAALMVVALMIHGFGFAKANAEYLYQQQITSFESIPPEKRGPMTQPPSKATPPLLTTGIQIGGRTVATIAGWLVWAGLLYLAGTFFGNNEVKYGPLFAMTLWAWTPYMVRNVLQGVVMAITDTPIYNQGLSGLVLDNAPPTPAFTPMGRSFIPPTRGEEVLAGLLARVDVYLIWHLILLVTGVAVFERLNRKKAVPLTLGIWLLTTGLALLPKILGLNSAMRIF
jgi:hypothetical protein